MVKVKAVFIHMWRKGKKMPVNTTKHRNVWKGCLSLVQDYSKLENSPFTRFIMILMALTIVTRPSVKPKKCCKLFWVRDWDYSNTPRQICDMTTWWLNVPKMPSNENLTKNGPEQTLLPISPLEDGWLKLNCWTGQTLYDMYYIFC